MDKKFPKLSLKTYAHGYESFYESIIEILDLANTHDILGYLLPDDLNSQYLFSDKRRQGFSRIGFLKEHPLLNGEHELFLSLVNEIIIETDKYHSKPVYELDKIHNKFNLILIRFSHLMSEVNNPEVFKLEFYYDKKNKKLKRKLDSITTKTINSNLNNVKEGNQIRYEECVSEFLSYKRDLLKENIYYYNNSLNNLKKVVENTLQNNFKKEDGSFPKLSNKKQISNIIFDSNETLFEEIIDYVVKNIHHENGGQPKKFTEKEYVFLWLELNKILYLLNRYV